MPPKKKDEKQTKKSGKTQTKTKSSNKKQTTNEDKLLRIRNAKEQRDMDEFYNRGEMEPEEETLEQKVRRNKKELKDNTF